MNTSTYIAGTGWLYRFDPRAKVLLMLLLCVFFFLPITLWGLYLTVALIVMVSALNPGLRYVRRTFLSILPMLIFMAIFAPFNVRSGSPLMQVGSTVILTEEGLVQAVRLAGRFIGITYVCTLLFATTAMNEVMLALRFYRLPYQAALVVTLSFTYIPFIADSFERISESHRLREPSDSRHRGFVQRLKDLIPTLTSALVVALRSIPNLAMSLEMRGYGRIERRTSYHSLEHYTRLFTDILISFTIGIVLWLVCKV